MLKARSLAVLSLILIGLAACQPPGAGGEGSEGGGDIFMSILPLILIFVVFYFLLIRPQQKKQKAHRAMLSDVGRGDDIVTNGGIVGHVVKVGRGDSLLVEIAPGVRVRVMRTMLSDVIRREPEYDEDEEEEEEDDEYEGEYEEEAEAAAEAEEPEEDGERTSEEKRES